MSERRRRRELEEARRQEEERRRRIAIARKRRRQRQIRRRRLLLAGIGALLLLILGILAAVAIHGKIQDSKEKAAQEKKRQEQEAAAALEEKNTLRVMAVGDNLIHEAFIQAGEENDWNFDFLYENIKEDLKEADLASVNQETPFTEDHKDAAGYPDFATPTEVGDALAKAGFQLITQATEHAYDQEAQGILTSVNFWKKNYEDVALLGIHKEEGEDRYQILEKKNFKIAVMNYSSMLSQNHSIPEEEAYMVDTYSEKKAKADIKAAKEEADVVIVYLHGGKDDSTEPDEKLQERVDFLAQQGADIVICSHPHILKGYEKLERSDGKETLVYYSLGNFVSDQASLENLLGGMADFTLKKDQETGEITIEEYGLVPLVMHYDSQYTNCAVYKLSDYTEALAKEHAIHETDEDAVFSVSALKSAAEEAGEIVSSRNVSDEGDSSGADQSGDEEDEEEPSESRQSRNGEDEEEPSESGQSRNGEDEEEPSGSGRNRNREDEEDSSDAVRSEDAGNTDSGDNSDEGDSPEE